MGSDSGFRGIFINNPWKNLTLRQYYLERCEEDVGLEEVEALVDDVLLVRSEGGRRRSPAGPLGSDLEREDGHVADELALGLDGRVVGRHSDQSDQFLV